MSSYQYKKYTTTDLIKLLQENEKGGATGKPREITFWVNSKPYHWLVPNGWGDGLVTDIGIYLKSDEQVQKLKDNHPHKPLELL